MDFFARSVLAWFEQSGRHDLPWQRDSTPYSVWVSEVMLQQTQVSTVVPYFERFMERFPSVEALAAAPSDEVLARWAGLGYYARARHLQRTAQIIVEAHGGELPRSVTELMALPGIGRSTAGAILALAHGERCAILDGNVKRVLTRFHAVEGWPGESKVQRDLWALAELHTPARRVAEYTQAIMDLGATVCTRATPRCAVCPVRSKCGARIAGRQGSLPAPRPRRERPKRHVQVLLVLDPEQRVLLQRRPPTGIWGGLFSLPELRTEDDPRHWCDRHLGAAVLGHHALAALEHAFTHFDLRLQPTIVELAMAPRRVMDEEGWLWYKPAHEMQVGVAAPIAALLRGLVSARESTA